MFIYKCVAFCWQALISCAGVGTKNIRKQCIFVAEIPENNVFAPKNLIYGGILVANVARISTYAL